eukprot:3482124-Alexandrium_andersonii.AAC.1
MSAFGQLGSLSGVVRACPVGPSYAAAPRLVRGDLHGNRSHRDHVGLSRGVDGHIGRGRGRCGRS